MPYIQDEKDDESQGDVGTGESQTKKTTDENQEAGGQISTLPSLSTDNSNAFGSATGGPTGGSDKSSSSGTFTNLQSYLSANEGNSPVSQITSKVAPEGEQAQTGLEQAQKAFQTNLDSQTKYNPDLIANAVNDPTAVDVNQVLAQRHANYSGTQGLDEAQGYNPDQASKVQSEIDQTKTEPGQFALLQNLVQSPNRPSYSKGEQSLDELLLQSQPSQQALQGLQSKYGQLGSQYATAEQGATTQAKAAADEAKRISDLANNQIQGGYNNLNSMMGTNYQTALTNAQRLQGAVPAAIASGNLGALSDQDLQNLGLSGVVGQTMGYDPRTYMGYNTPTISNTASAADIAKIGAYGKLLERPDLGNIYDPSQAGSYNQPITFDSGRYQKDVADAMQRLRDTPEDYRSVTPIMNSYAPGSFGAPEGYLTLGNALAGIEGERNQNKDYLVNHAGKVEGSPEYNESMAGYDARQQAINDKFQNLVNALGTIKRS